MTGRQGLWLAAAVLAVAPSAGAAVVSVSATAPGSAPPNQSQLGTGTLATGGDDANYVADDRPAQGQTFTLPSAAAATTGFRVDSITVKGAGGVSSGGEAGNFTLTGRIVTLNTTTNVITPIYTETAAPVPNTTLGGSFSQFLTFTFNTPPVLPVTPLAVNTTYGFDLGGTGRFYFQLDGAANTTYPAGSSYTTGTAGVAGATAILRDGDRTFVVNLTPIPEPASLGLLGAGSLALLGRRRRRA